MAFSQRLGIIPVQIVQLNEMTDDLANSIWNCIYQEFNLDETYNDRYHSYLSSFFRTLWIDFFKIPVDSLRIRHSDNKNNFKEMFFRSSWNRKYDLVEFLIGSINHDKANTLSRSINSILERENSGYRIIDGIISPISSHEEAVEVGNALQGAAGSSGFATHLKTALLLMSDRNNPDYRNSIKESISAVESACSEIVGDDKSTLGKLLNKIQATGNMHPSLAKAFSNLYGWTSDEGGIRHAMLEEPNLSLVDARFMLIACSAFVNYALDKTK